MTEYLGIALSILYLLITPFIWRKLVNSLERLGWMAGLILAGTGLISWVYGDVSFSYKIPIAVSAIVVLGFTGVWHKIKKKSNSEKGNHSEKIGKAIIIMCEGHHGEYLDKMEFLIPYPYSEYKEYQRKSDFPTITESIELFNKRDWSDREEEKHEFVPIDKSPEGDFQRAWDHLKSYKHINKLFDEAKQASEDFHVFTQTNKQRRNK